MNPLFLCIYVLLILIAALNISASRTVRFLEAYGVLGVLQKVWINLSHYFSIAMK